MTQFIKKAENGHNPQFTQQQYVWCKWKCVKDVMHFLAKRARTYISLGLGLVVVGFGAGDLGGGVHFILQLCDLLRQLLQGLHDVGPLLGFHPPVLLQAVYQGLEEGGGRAVREKKVQKTEKELG